MVLGGPAFEWGSLCTSEPVGPLGFMMVVGDGARDTGPHWFGDDAGSWLWEQTGTPKVAPRCASVSCSDKEAQFGALQRVLKGSGTLPLKLAPSMAPARRA